MKQIIFSIIFVGMATFAVVGQTKFATDFSLKNVDGKTISLNDFKSEKGVILTFVSNVCPVAEDYQKRIEALQQKYAAKGFPLVAIDPVDSFDEMKEVAESRKYSYKFLFDSDQKIAKTYKIKSNTHTFVLLNTKKGFQVVYEGRIDDDWTGKKVTKNYIENAVDAVLNNKIVGVKRTNILGCPINYRK